MTLASPAAIRHDWHLDEIEALFALPFNDLLFQAQQVHRQHFDANAVQVSTLLSIKTGACPEDCAYCSQSKTSNAHIPQYNMLDREQLLDGAREASQRQAKTYCIVISARSPSQRELDEKYQKYGISPDSHMPEPGRESESGAHRWKKSLA